MKEIIGACLLACVGLAPAVAQNIEGLVGDQLSAGATKKRNQVDRRGLLMDVANIYSLWSVFWKASFLNDRQPIHAKPCCR